MILDTYVAAFTYYYRGVAALVSSAQHANSQHCLGPFKKSECACALVAGHSDNKGHIGLATAARSSHRHRHSHQQRERGEKGKGEIRTWQRREQ